MSLKLYQFDYRALQFLVHVISFLKLFRFRAFRYKTYAKGTLTLLQCLNRSSNFKQRQLVISSIILSLNAINNSVQFLWICQANCVFIFH